MREGVPQLLSTHGAGLEIKKNRTIPVLKFSYLQQSQLQSVQVQGLPFSQPQPQPQPQSQLVGTIFSNIME